MPKQGKIKAEFEMFIKPALLLLILMPAHYHFTQTPEAGTDNTNTNANDNLKPSKSNVGVDSFSIRHERSKARHSNEKEHMLWSLRSHSTNLTIHDALNAAGITTNGNVTMTAQTGIVSNTISKGSGTAYADEFWQNSATNGTIIGSGIITEVATLPSTTTTMTSAEKTHRTKRTPTANPYAGTTLVPVTHKIRKLHKKKIKESIRNSMNRERGVKLSKNHRSLAQAEQMQGRPTDVSIDDSNESTEIKLRAALPSAGGISLDNSVVGDVKPSPDETVDVDVDDDDDGNMYKDDEYQNDEYVTTTASGVTMRTSTHGLPGELPFMTFAPASNNANLDDSADDNLRLDFALETTTLRNKRLLGLYERTNSVLKRLTSNASWNQTVTKGQKRLKSEMKSVIKMDVKEAKETPIPMVDSQLLVYNAEHNRTRLMEDDNAVVADNAVETVTEFPSTDTTVDIYDHWPDLNAREPNQLASTSVGGIGLDRQQSMEVEEINFEDVGIDASEEDTMDDELNDNRKASGFPVSVSNNVQDGDEENGYEVNQYLAGVVDAAKEDEFYDWDEISRNNRRNLMRGRDVVTKFLQIVETQHSLGSNCEAGTSLNLGEGVVDRYAQDRFRVEAEVAVNRANMLTRIFKMTSSSVQADVNLLHASVLSMVEFDDDIFAAGNCFDWNEHPAQPGLFCPFAYRLPPPYLGAILAKNLATEYHYLGNTSEWFFQARKNAEKVIARNEQYLKAFHQYSNKSDERMEDDTLAVKYEDGKWSKPYYDCGGGNIWMLTYTVPFFGYENGTYHFKGTSGIDIDLRRVDIDQCPQRNTPGMTQPLNIFAGTDKCKQRTTMCEALKGLGFRRGSYKCVCRKGFYFPDIITMQKYFNGSLLEEEYEKLMLGKNSTYNIINEYECLPCAEGCDSCMDGSPCIAALNWPMRTSILVLACTVIGLLPPAAWFTFRYQQVKVVRAASPALLRVIALGAFFIYCTNIVMYPNPNLYTCTARIWLREIGFSLTYGALMLKTWRISVIFRVRSAKAVKITDAALLKRLGIICGVISIFLLIRTLVAPPDVVVGRTADDLKAFLCKTDWWDYTFTSMEVLFLAWGVRLCIMVRKAPSEFNESRFISMAIYNEFLLTCFLNVSMLFLQSPANPDLLYIIFFCHTQLTVTLLLGLIFGSKVYIVLRSGKSHQESIGMGAKSSGAKFNFRPQVRTFANPSSVTTSTAPVAGTTSAETKLSDQEALEEIRQLSMQLQRIQEMAPPKGVAVMTISSLLDGLRTPGGVMIVAAAAATQASSTPGNQLSVRQPGALPLLALNTELHKYNQQQQLQVPQQLNNIGVIKSEQQITRKTPPSAVASAPSTPIKSIVHREVNTDLSGEILYKELSADAARGHIICSRCLKASQEHYYTCQRHSPPTTCQQLGSPKDDGSLSFANIKLECMCSQPDDLDRQPARRTAVRSAATNTPPTTGSARRRGKALSLHDGDMTYHICDNCRKKYFSSKKSGKKVRNKHDAKSLQQQMTLSGATSADGVTLNQARSNDLLERLATTGTTCSSNKKMHSTDDILFYTTTDDDESEASETHPCGQKHNVDFSDDDRASNSKRQCHVIQMESHCLSSEGDANDVPVTSTVADTGANLDASSDAHKPANNSNNSSESDNTQSNKGNNTNNDNGNENGSGDSGSGSGAGRSKRPDKLVLDLNDRSKYTKEVSV